MYVQCRNEDSGQCHAGRGGNLLAACRKARQNVHASSECRSWHYCKSQHSLVTVYNQMHRSILSGYSGVTLLPKRMVSAISREATAASDMIIDWACSRCL